MAIATGRGELVEKLPPQNIEAERAALGCMLLANDVIDEVADIIQPRHFYHHANHRIAEAIYRLYDQSVGGVDVVTLAEELEKRDLLAEVGGKAYLLEILETVPHAAHAKHYAEIVRDKWTLRTLREACTHILNDVAEEGESTEEILAHAEQRIFKILELKGSADKLEIRDILMEAFDSINERWMNEGKISGLSLGFGDLDSRTNGLNPSELVILAARPSMGKTAFVCNIALNVAVDARARHRDEGKPDADMAGGGVLIFSLEQSKVELAERFLCILGKFDGHKLRKGTLNAEEIGRVQETASELGELPIFIDDQAGRSMAEIAAISRRLKRRNDIGLIIIDYLQLIEPEDKKAPREQQVSQIARRLKFLAKEIHAPVVALAQLNRGVELRENKQPRLADLRESGAIEQDADLVMFLHRPDAYDPADRPGEAEVIVAKHRNGPTGVVTLTWLRESMKFADHSRMVEPEGGFGFEGGSGDSF